LSYAGCVVPLLAERPGGSLAVAGPVAPVPTNPGFAREFTIRTPAHSIARVNGHPVSSAPGPREGPTAHGTGAVAGAAQEADLPPAPAKPLHQPNPEPMHLPVHSVVYLSRQMQLQSEAITPAILARLALFSPSHMSLFSRPICHVEFQRAQRRVDTDTESAHLGLLTTVSRKRSLRRRSCTSSATTSSATRLCDRAQFVVARAERLLCIPAYGGESEAVIEELTHRTERVLEGMAARQRHCHERR